MLFTEAPFLARPDLASTAGFGAIECLFPYDTPADELAAAVGGADLTTVLLNAPPGDWQRGDRGIAAIPDRRAEFDLALAGARDYAVRLGCPRVHVLAGLAVQGADVATYTDGLRHAADVLGADGIGVLVEPLNPIDYPGYLVADPYLAADIVAAAGPGVQLQADVYHLAMGGWDPIAVVDALLPIIGHVQIAGPPTRSEPTADRIDAAGLFGLLAQRGYGGWVGCEYHPAASTIDGLDWAAPFLGAVKEVGS